MFNHTSIGLAVMMLAASSGQAGAQTASTPKRIERIEVTGSRILSFNAELAVPCRC